MREPLHHAMTPSRQVCRCLDEEHRALLEMLGRIEQALVRGTAADLAQLVGPLQHHLEHEVGRHFDFEEQQLFPLMADAGDGDMAALLTEEHGHIRAVVAELAPLARTATAEALAPPSATLLKQLLLELLERQVSHIQKEAMALLPLLDDLLDEETDRRLAFEYAAG